jgi:hypothetical protein
LIKPKSLLTRFVSGKDGRVHIIQWPNLPIVGWFLSMTVATFVASGSIKAGFLNVSLAFLAIWSYLEVTQGLSYFRRALGVIIGILTVYSLFR